MTSRTERIASIRERAEKLAGCFDELAREHSRPDFSGLSDKELQLMISLTTKAHGCSALVGVPLLEKTECELIAASHSGYGMALKSFDLNRLTPAEQAKYNSLAKRVNERSEYSADGSEAVKNGTEPRQR
jgi:hypothetical protein